MFYDGITRTAKFNYVFSCDLNINLKIKIGTLEGKRLRPSYKELLEDPLLTFSGFYQGGCSDLFVTCQLYSYGKQLALPMQTSYKPFTTRWNWNEWLTLPLKFADLPRNALLAFTVWDCYGPRKAVPVGGTTVSVFGKHGALRQGMHDLCLWPNVEADGMENSTTPGKIDGHKEQIVRLSKMTKKHRNGRIMKVDWLDRLTFREIEMIHEQEKRNSPFMYLMIEFPCIIYEGIEYTVMYFEKDAEEKCRRHQQADIVIIPDPEISMENLVESKHHKLVRSVRSGLSDRDLKPNTSTRDQLNVIVNYPPTKVLTSEEQDLVWKFRFYLTSQKKALAKFLKCVNWNVAGEAKQALELLTIWQVMDVEDALELLSPSFSHPSVRRYAVTRLQQAPDEDLLLYLLQLVQALKYENYEEIFAGLEQRKDSTHATVIAEPIMSLPGDKERTSTMIKDDSMIYQENSQDIRRDSITTIRKDSVTTMVSESTDYIDQVHDLGNCDLATFLINKACANDTLANFFYWYLLVECEDQENITRDTKVTQMYTTVMKRFSNTLTKGGRDLRLRRSQLARQQNFVDKLVLLMKTVAKESGNRRKKIERLQSLLSDPEINKINFTNFDPLPLPLDPEVKIRGICPEKATLFKSALMPGRLTFLGTDGSEYVAIFKHGDDLRQDQLVLQTITLMDKLLRRENLDLKLTPYRVLATSSRHGFVQCIESIAVAEVLATEGSIQNFFRKHSPSETGPYGIAVDVIDAYVKSCAGYCVITYLLGVGDRHLDNLLLTKTGKLFHVDFGYILGSDPKPLPPPMKLSKEMVEAMGGISAEHYLEFRKQCYTAFLHLRRNANLILNLFSLMVDASVPDIALEPDKTVKKLQDKFRLDLNDEEAVRYMQSVIDISVSDVMAALVEQIHKFAQYWRR